MKKIFLILLCLIASICSAQPSHYGPYDPGAIRSDGTNASDTVTLNRIKTATGTAAAPAYSFSSDPDTGIYSPGANALGVVSDGTERMRITSGGNVLIATSTDDGVNKLQVNGFTKLGEAATGIKMKVLTGTTGTTEGVEVKVAHGLTGTKIVGFTCKVEYGANTGIPPFSYATGLEYYFGHDATNVQVTLHPTNSENILEKPFTVMLWYKE